MSGDCIGCAEAVMESASVIAALVRRLDSEGVELADDELARFTKDSAVVFRRGESGLRIEVREEASCGS